MALTALDIQNQSFGTSRHGYDPQEVDVFLERIATETDNFNRALQEARSQIEAAENRAKAAEYQANQAIKATQAAQAAQSAKGSTEAVATEKQIAQAFIAAQRSADDLRESARKESEKVYREAEMRARDIVRDALAEKQRILEEIDRLRVSTEKFRTEYLALLNHFSADAQKTMPTIDTIAPDISQEKQAAKNARELFSADAIATRTAEQTLTSEPTPTPMPAPEQVSTPVPASAPESLRATDNTQSNVSAQITLDDLDDELDIEEID
ncbi:MAG: DivIVA domain-containing protein [Coriobacteriales bacterium]|jgi:cell division initiation protein|nr:DivIVA domain-containing protein [Coriobacteriales bacterium]